MTEPKRRGGRGKTVRTAEKKALGIVKFTDEEHPKVLEEVAHLYRRGWTQADIAERISQTFGTKITQVTVSNYLKEIRELMAQTVTWDVQQLIVEMLDKYRDIRKEAWIAWEKSKQKLDRVVREKGLRAVAPGEAEANGKGKKTAFRNKVGHDGGPSGRLNRDHTEVERKMVLLKTILTREGRNPAVAYLQVVMDTLAEERKLLGLDKRPEEGTTLEEEDGFSWAKFARLAVEPDTGRNDAMALLESMEAQAKLHQQQVETARLEQNK